MFTNCVGMLKFSKIASSNSSYWVYIQFASNVLEHLLRSKKQLVTLLGCFQYNRTVNISMMFITSFKSTFNGL